MATDGDRSLDLALLAVRLRCRHQLQGLYGCPDVSDSLAVSLAWLSMALLQGTTACQTVNAMQLHLPPAVAVSLHLCAHKQ